MYVKRGTYTGNGSSQSITGVGFTPKFVWIKAAGSHADVLFIDTMPSGDSKLDNATTLINNGITAIGSDGFDVGSHAAVNTNTTVYYYLAIGGSDVSTFSYTGTGANQSITGAGFAPEAVLTTSPASTAVVLKATGMSSTQYFPINGSAGNSSGFPSLDADGFTVGNHVSAGSNGNTYYAVALNESTGFKHLSYTGTGSAHNETGVGFDPTWVVVKKWAGSTGQLRTSDHSGNSSYLGIGLNTLANCITALVTDGFTVGTSNDVNQNTITYSSLNFIDNAPAPPGSIERDVPASAALQSTLARTVAASAALQSTRTRAVPASTALQSTLTRTVPASAATLSTFTRTVPASAALSATETRDVPASASLSSSSLTRTVPASASISGGTARTVPASAALMSTLARTVAVSAALKSTLSRDVDASAALSSTLTRTVAASAALSAIETREVPASAALKSTLSRSVPVSAATSSTLTRTVPASASLTLIGTRTVPASAALSSTLTRTVPASASLRIQGDSTPGSVLYKGFDVSSVSSYTVLDGSEGTTYNLTDGSEASTYTIQERKALA